MIERLLAEFHGRIGGEPTLLVRAPGRVNLIGEHTDYNDGFVLPMALDRAAWIALRPTHSPQVHVFAADLDDEATFSVDELYRSPGGWAEYVKGTAWSLREAGHAITGWDGVLAADVPIGAGLSSSAAIEVAATRAFCAVSDVAWDPPVMARLAQRAENAWVGVNCGIMDQLVSASGRDGHALLIDCRSLSTTPVAIPPDWVVAVLDTMTRRDLVSSAYNERRAVCDAAARTLGVAALRDADEAALERARPRLDPPAYRRTRHVVSENRRTLEAAEAMAAGMAGAFGRLMNESHASLRDDFEVSSAALDTMVDCALEAGCHGARHAGAGFGGCCVALVEDPAAESFVVRVANAYEARTGRRPVTYLCRPSAGASLETFGPGVRR
jgi:galactokinase